MAMSKEFMKESDVCLVIEFLSMAQVQMQTGKTNYTGGLVVMRSDATGDVVF